MAGGFKKGLIKIARVISHKSPTIFAWSAIGGVVWTTASAIKATTKAVRIIDEKGIKNEDVPKLEIVKDTIKLTWPCYISTLIIGGATIFCIHSSNSINHKRNAALVSLCSLTELAFKEYQEQVVKTIGAKKEREVRDEVYKERIINHPPTQNKTDIIITGKGETLCYETTSGRYFKSDIESIRKMENELNRAMLSDMFIPLNEVYYALGLPDTKLGKELGWDIDNGLIEFTFSSQLTDGVPCLVVDCGLPSTYDYRDY